VGKLALAMHEAHKMKVIHRDLKPANVIIETTGERREPVIVDFGLARQDSPEEVRFSRTGQVTGTLGYMAPEQIRGDLKEIGPACDIYALRVILYELLTGRLPFSGSGLEVASQILTVMPLPPSTYQRELDPALETICLKALAKPARDRYTSMGELAAALTGFLRSPSATAMPTLPAGPPGSSAPNSAKPRHLEPDPVNPQQPGPVTRLEPSRRAAPAKDGERLVGKKRSVAGQRKNEGQRTGSAVADRLIPFGPEPGMEGGHKLEGQKTTATLLASRRTRFNAAVLDGFIQFAFTFALFQAITYFDIEIRVSRRPSVMSIVFGVLLGLCFTAIHGYLLIKNGQTIGKKLTGIRIADLDGDVPNFWKVIGLRYLPTWVNWADPDRFFYPFSILFIFDNF